MTLGELLMKTPQERASRDLLGDYGAILNRRRKERGVTKIELSAKTGVSCEDIDLVEKGLVELSCNEKQRIAKFLRRQRII